MTCLLHAISAADMPTSCRYQAQAVLWTEWQTRAARLHGGGDLAGGAARLERGVVGHGVGLQLGARLPHRAQQHQRLQNEVVVWPVLIAATTMETDKCLQG